MMIEFFHTVHYVVYRFYRRHKEDLDVSMFYTCTIHCILSFLLIMEADYFLSLLLDTPFHINKPIAFAYMIVWAIFEYKTFFRNKRYLELFGEYDRQSDTPAMKAKLKNARIFNFSLLAIDIILLFLMDYCNHHK